MATPKRDNPLSKKERDYHRKTAFARRGQGDAGEALWDAYRDIESLEGTVELLENEVNRLELEKEKLAEEVERLHDLLNETWPEGEEPPEPDEGEEEELPLNRPVGAGEGEMVGDKPLGEEEA